MNSLNIVVEFSCFILLYPIIWPKTNNNQITSVDAKALTLMGHNHYYAENARVFSVSKSD